MSRSKSKKPAIIHSISGQKPHKNLTVAFQGVAGAYSEIAARLAYPEAILVPVPTFHEVLMAVSSGETDYGVLPIENSLAGTVFASFDLLLQSDLHIVREVALAIKHNLLALPGTKLENIVRAYSHPQALTQCDGFLARNGIIPMHDTNTAIAAQNLIQRGHRDEAVIASRRVAELYGLDIIASNLEDEPFNYTRFFILSKDEPIFEPGPHKTSLVFALRNQAAALLDSLSELKGLNLTRIESRPRRDKAWSYLIYIDFEGHIKDPIAVDALIGLLRRAAFVKVLGSYLYNIDPVSESAATNELQISKLA